jgi:hypothetical protein
MSLTIFLAQIFGPLFIVACLGMLMNRSVFERILQQMTSQQNSLVMFFIGCAVFTIGLFLVLVHNVWTNTYEVVFYLIRLRLDKYIRSRIKYNRVGSSYKRNITSTISRLFQKAHTENSSKRLHFNDASNRYCSWFVCCLVRIFFIVILYFIPANSL